MSTPQTLPEAIQRVREAKAALAAERAENARLDGASPTFLKYLEAKADLAALDARIGAENLKKDSTCVVEAFSSWLASRTLRVTD